MTNLTREILNNETASGTSAVKVDFKFEIVVIPVSDVDRAKEFYGRLGWRLDADFPFDNGFRVVQFTPPGSGCSIIFGKNVTDAAPGSAQGLYLIVSDIEAARKDLLGRGVKISEVLEVVVGDSELPHRAVRTALGARRGDGTLAGPLELEALRALRATRPALVPAPPAP